VFKTKQALNTISYFQWLGPLAFMVINTGNCLPFFLSNRSPAGVKLGNNDIYAVMQKTPSLKKNTAPLAFPVVVNARFLSAK
jgi:hypothetical protein